MSYVYPVGRQLRFLGGALTMYPLVNWQSNMMHIGILLVGIAVSVVGFRYR